MCPYCKRCEDRFKKYVKECDDKWQKQRKKRGSQ